MNVAEAVVFTDLSGYRTAYDQCRGDVLAAHGHPRDTKNVRVKGGFFVLDVLLAGGWAAYTDDNVTARDRVKAGGTFRLRIKPGALPNHPRG